ncbi:MAG: PEP-CTERM sorting domain-containing protein [bacterium]
MPQGLAFDNQGNLYVANLGNTIAKFNQAGVFQSAISTNLNAPLGLAIDASGNIYAANIGDNTISKYNIFGAYQGSISTNINSPYGVGFDYSSQDLYVVNSGSNNVLRFDPSGNLISTIGDSSYLNGPVGIGFDKHNNMYVPNYGSNSLAKIDYPYGSGTLTTGGFLTNAYGIAFDSVGSYYVSTGSFIAKFNSGGQYQFSWATPAQASFAAVTTVTVPEPGSLILATFATLGLIAMKRRQSAATGIN